MGEVTLVTICSLVEFIAASVVANGFVAPFWCVFAWFHLPAGTKELHFSRHGHD